MVRLFFGGLAVALTLATVVAGIILADFNAKLIAATDMWDAAELQYSVDRALELFLVLGGAAVVAVAVWAFSLLASDD